VEREEDESSVSEMRSKIKMFSELTEALIKDIKNTQ
jgi:hypothetical protein